MKELWRLWKNEPESQSFCKGDLKEYISTLWWTCVIHAGRFGNAIGTQKHYLALVLFQRYWVINYDVSACFIDYQKTFDRSQHPKIFREHGNKWKDLRILTDSNRQKKRIDKMKA